MMGDGRETEGGGEEEGDGREWFFFEKKLRLTVDRQRNSDETGDTGEKEASGEGPPPTEVLPVEQEDTDNVRWNLDESGDHCVDEDVTRERSSVQGQRIVD